MPSLVFEGERYFLVRNMIQCTMCSEVIETRAVNDYIRCRCGHVAISGGFEYPNQFYGKPEDILDVSIWKTKAGKELDIGILNTFFSKTRTTRVETNG